MTGSFWEAAGTAASMAARRDSRESMVPWKVENYSGDAKRAALARRVARGSRRQAAEGYDGPS